MQLLSICTVALLIGAAQREQPVFPAASATEGRTAAVLVAVGGQPLNPLEAILGAREAARRAQAANNLKQLALAMHNYEGMHGQFPAPANYDKQGKPLLSWRVHLLPYLDENELYRKFKLDEPWDSPHNKKLIAEMPNLFKSPGSKLKEEGRTNCLLPVGKDTAFATDKPVKAADIKDGLSNTIMIVEAADSHAVIWTKPEDLRYDPQKPLAGLDGPFPKVFLAAMFDGSVRFIDRGIDQKVLRALFTPAGGEPIED